MRQEHLTQLLTSVGLLTIAGCATVEPAPDYQRTRELITERTDIEEVYDPDAEATIDAKVAEILTEDIAIDDALRIALLNNPAFQSLFLELGVSRAEVVQSGLLSNPSFYLSLRFPEGGGLTDLTLGFAQQLVDLWQIPVRRKIAESKMEQTVLTIAQRAIDLRAEVKRSGYELLALQQASQIAQDGLDLVERSFKLAQDRFSAGEINKLDVNLTRADMLNVKAGLISLHREEQIARLSLEKLMGLSQRQVSWELHDDWPAAASIAEDDVLVLQAMTDRLDARVAALEVREAEAAIKREYLNIFPDVAVGAEWERPEQRALPGRKILAETARESIRNGGLTAPTIESKGERNLERRQIIDSILGPSIEFTLPLWDQNQAQIAKAAFIAQQKRKDFEDLLDVVASEVRQAAATARSNTHLAEFYKQEVLQQAKENVESASQTYSIGQDNIIVLIEAQRFLIEQQQAYLSIVRDAAIAIADLERALGGQLSAAAQNTEPSAAPQAGESL